MDLIPMMLGFVAVIPAVVALVLAVVIHKLLSRPPERPEGLFPLRPKASNVAPVRLEVPGGPARVVANTDKKAVRLEEKEAREDR